MATLPNVMPDSPSNPSRSDESVGKSGVQPHLSDAEVICSFMEPKPGKSPTDFHPWRDWSDGGWWRGEMPGGDPSVAHWVHRSLTLDVIWEVEERLTADQVTEYLVELLGITTDLAVISRGVHATTAQKITALAASLQSRVLPKEDAQGTQAYQERSR